MRLAPHLDALLDLVVESAVNRVLAQGEQREMATQTETPAQPAKLAGVGSTRSLGVNEHEDHGRAANQAATQK
jgi:hypothetical protein